LLSLQDARDESEADQLPQESSSFPTTSRNWCIFDLFWRRDVLSLAITKGPIFLRDFNKADEDIFLANLYSFVEMVRQCFVEALLQLSGTAAIQCDLKKDAIVRPMYSEIVSIEWQARLRVFRDYLKSVMFRNIENIHQGLVKNIADLSTVLF
jgi:hypothetical protein